MAKPKHYQHSIQKVSDLIPYVNNSRTHSDEQVNQVASSIKEFGFTSPILIDEKGGIIAGHGRVMAASKLGVDEVPCITLEGLTEAQKKAYIIADNQLPLNAGWDLDKLKLEIDTLTELDFDIDLLGFDDDFLDGLLDGQTDEGLTDEDAVPELPETPVSVLGDIWKLGNHRLMCGDSTSIDAVEKLMDGQKADMVFTDPPYGINMNRILVSGKDNTIKNDNMDFLSELLELVIKNVFLAAKEGAGVYIWIGFRAYSIAENELLKFRSVSNCIVWKKPSIGMGKKGYRFQHELCLFSGDVESNSVSDVWEFNRDASGLHPTMKPVELVNKAINNSSKKGDFILDVFGGSGSTLVACETTNRICNTMELDEKYVDVIINRWQNFTGKEAVHIESGKTYAEMSSDKT